MNIKEVSSTARGSWEPIVRVVALTMALKYLLLIALTCVSVQCKSSCMFYFYVFFFLLFYDGIVNILSHLKCIGRMICSFAIVMLLKIDMSKCMLCLFPVCFFRHVIVFDPISSLMYKASFITTELYVASWSIS